MTPARISGVSMLPPWASGTSAERTSRFAGATPTVPCMGSIGRSTVKSPNRASNRHSRAARSSCHIHTTSGSGSCSVAVRWVEVRAPNSGTVVDAAQSRAGSMDTKCTARVSPGTAPSTWNGPVCGFTNGNSTTSETRSPVPRTRPAKQSSVNSSSTVPGAMRATGAVPPNVHTYSPAVGRYRSTSLMSGPRRGVPGPRPPPAAGCGGGARRDTARRAPSRSRRPGRRTTSAGSAP